MAARRAIPRSTGARNIKFDFVPKLRIEVAVPDEIADKAIEIIAENARTGEIGDGKIFVMPIDHAIRIRTGEGDSDAL